MDEEKMKVTLMHHSQLEVCFDEFKEAIDYDFNVVFACYFVRFYIRDRWAI